jgi:hypothetical protein
MIFLIFLTGFVLWLTVTIMLSKKIPRWLGITKNGAVISVLLFPLILVAPIADELIGRWQFKRLCEREAVVTLSPDWAQVKRARQKPDVRRDFDGYLIPIHSWGGDIVDVDTGKVFFTSKSLFTSGGFLFGRLGLGLDTQATSCQPVNIQAVQKQVNLFELLKQGKTK